MDLRFGENNLSLKTNRWKKYHKQDSFRKNLWKKDELFSKAILLYMALRFCYCPDSMGLTWYSFQVEIINCFWLGCFSTKCYSMPFPHSNHSRTHVTLSGWNHTASILGVIFVLISCHQYYHWRARVLLFTFLQWCGIRQLALFELLIINTWA
jgi:hypothetical protein